MTSAPDARKRSACAAIGSRVRPRSVVDLGEDLDVPGAVVARRPADAPEVRGISRRSFGPFSTGTPTFSLMSDGVAFAEPGNQHEVGAFGNRRDVRPIHVVVISAATVIRSTATSYAKGGAISASMRRSAGSASRPGHEEDAARVVGGLRFASSARIAAPHELVRRPARARRPRPDATARPLRFGGRARKSLSVMPPALWVAASP